MAVDLDKIDKVDTNITVPSVDDKLMETEKHKWGIILNNAFNILNNNIKIYKEIILELANAQNSLDLSDILLRLKNLEIDRDSIESIVDNNTNGLINVGITERKLNLKGTELEFNGNKIDTNNIVYNNDLTNVAYTNRENIFNENIDNNKLYKLKGGNVLEKVDNKIKVGNISNKLDLQTTDGTFLVNGEEFRLPNNVSDNPFKEFESKSIMRLSLPLEEGSVAGNNETRLVTFNRVFTSIPFVFVNLVRDNKVFSIVSIYNVTTTGFKLSLNYAGGDSQVQYIAFTLKD